MTPYWKTNEPMYGRYCIRKAFEWGHGQVNQNMFDT